MTSRGDQPDNAPAEGLHGPRGGLAPVAIEDLEPPRRRSPLRITLQIIGTVLSLALLVWAATQALTPENQESLERLGSAPPHLAIALVALVLAGVVLNGVIFQTILAHTHRLGTLHLTAVTGIATLLAFAPFKLSLLARVFIHRRRDHLRYRTLIAWLAAVGGLSLCVLGPATLASVWRAELDLLWFLGGVVGPAGLLALAVAVARRVRRVPALHAVTLGSADYATDPGKVAALGALRLTDLASMALRFTIAGWILGIDLTSGAAIVAASVYFITGIVSPAGNLGAREGAVTGVGFLPAIDAHEQFALLALTVTAAEIVGALIAGALGALYERPDRLLASAVPPASDQPHSPEETETSSSVERPDR
jgi:hypothetical protein